MVSAVKGPTATQVEELVATSGLSKKEFGDRLGVSRFAVHAWIDPKNPRNMPVGLWEFAKVQHLLPSIWARLQPLIRDR